jgi:hypothetical protein
MGGAQGWELPAQQSQWVNQSRALPSTTAFLDSKVHPPSSCCPCPCAGSPGVRLHRMADPVGVSVYVLVSVAGSADACRQAASGSSRDHSGVQLADQASGTAPPWAWRPESGPGIVNSSLQETDKMTPMKSKHGNPDVLNSNNEENSQLEPAGVRARTRLKTPASELPGN